MDAIIEEIATFVTDLDFDDLPDELTAAATTRIVDAIGCALAAMNVPTVRAASQLHSAGTSDGPGGRVIGALASGHPADLAAFMNTSMIRDLDYNDWSPNGHPSDCLGGILALSDLAGLSGQDLVGSMVMAYEIFMRLMDASRLPYLGWDHGFAMGIATTAATGKLLGLTVPELGDAISIVATSGVPTKATRAGELAMWKGCATAFAVRNAIFAALLAKSGVTGPAGAFEGRYGIFNLITGPFELGLPSAWSPDFCITRSSLKYWPFCYYSQVPASAAMELRSIAPHIEDLESVQVLSHEETVVVTADAEKWDPQTAETADHSTPYIVARLLRDGGLTPDAFKPEGFLDPTLRPLMARVHVETGEEANSLFPETIMATLVAKDRDGKSFQVEVRNPRGHADNPMTPSEVHEKFVRLASAATEDTSFVEEMYQAWNTVSEAKDLSAVLDRLADVSR